MITERLAKGLVPRQHRLDHASETGNLATSRIVYVSLLSAIAIGFVLIGGGSMELSDAEARLGLAASDSMGPVGQVFGGYDPSLAPARVAISQLWAMAEGGIPSVGAIRWPAAIAAVGIGLLLARRVASIVGPRAGVFAGLCAMGSIGLIDRSSAVIGDPVMGLAILAAIDRCLSRSSDWIAGAFASAAVMLGGWPALAAILLPIIAIGRPGGSASWKLLIPPIATFAAWSAWAISATRAEVWAASLTIPISGPSTWKAGLGAIAAMLPWSPIALGMAFPTVRAGLGDRSRGFVMNWGKVAIVGLLVASIVPGMGPSGGLLILGGLVMIASIVLEQAWVGAISGTPKLLLLGFTLVTGVILGGLAIWTGAFLAAAQPYFRGVGIVVIGLGLATALVAIDSAWMRATRGVGRTLILVAILAKTIHAGYQVPETNYRFGKGPWGRAVGQYVPPRSSIFVFHSISPALAFATEHPVRQLTAPEFLKVQSGDGPKFVLLTDSEFSHWPKDAPAIQKVRTFEDEFGGTRVLARTPGSLIHQDVD